MVEALLSNARSLVVPKLVKGNVNCAIVTVTSIIYMLLFIFVRLITCYYNFGNCAALIVVAYFLDHCISTNCGGCISCSIACGFFIIVCACNFVVVFIFLD